MATVNCNVRTPWNDTKCHRFAGTGYNEFYSHITTVEEVGSQSEKNGKHEVSHTSSDDYNGYLPTVPDIDDYAMDTNDAGAENSMENGRDPKNDSCMSALIHTSDLNENVRSVGITLGRRKRINDEHNTTAEPKRQRHEEFCGLTPCEVKVLPTTRSFDAHYQRCIMEHDSVSEKVSDSSLQFMTDGCDLELVEKLLKETHGCDLYHFDTCDL